MSETTTDDARDRIERIDGWDDLLRDDGAFPRSTAVALERGIEGAASFPLPTSDGRSVGSLNLFYDKARWIDDGDGESPVGGG